MALRRSACHIYSAVRASHLFGDLPMHYPSFLKRAVAVASIALPLAGAHAQSRPAASTTGQQTSPVAKPAEGKILQLEDYARFNRITSPALSADGKWMTFTYTPNEGGQTILHVKALDGSKDYTVTLGAAAGGRAGGGGGGRGGAGGGNGPGFTEDSKWAVYPVTPATRGGGAGGAAPGGRGGRGRGGAPAPGRGAADTTDASAAVAHLELLNLATGEKAAIPDAASWKFSSDAHWLAVKLNRAAAPAADDGAAAGGRGGRGGRGGGVGPPVAAVPISSCAT